MDFLAESKASTTALKQVQTIAEQRDYSSFLKDIFEYISVQVKETTSVTAIQGLETSKEYVDKQCKKTLNSLTERLDRFERYKEDTRVDTLERAMEAIRLQSTLLAERINKLDYLLRVEDSEFKVSVLCQQLIKLETNVDRLKSNVQAHLSQRSITPVPALKRPYTVGQTRPITSSHGPPKPLEAQSALSLPSPPHQTASLVLNPISPSSPAKPTGRATAQVRVEVPTPPLIGTVESTPVSARKSWERRGRVRSGKPFADSRVQNQRLLDDMVIFNARVAAP